MAAAKAAPVAGDDINAGVVDCGSWMIRFGSSGDDMPRGMMPPVAGLNTAEDGTVTRVAGDKVLLAPCSFPDVAPVFSFQDDGSAVVSDWDAMGAVWQAGAAASGVDLTAAPLMIVEPARGWSEPARAKAMELAFEGCNVEAAYLGRGAAMAAFAAARTTACVVDAGNQGASAVPVSDGYVLRKSTKSSVVGGHFLSERLYEYTDDQLRGGEVGAMRVAIGETVSKVRALHEVNRKLKSDEPPKDTDGRVQSRCTARDISMLAPQASFTDAHRTFYRMKLMDEIRNSTYRVSPGGAKNGSDGNAEEDIVMGDAPATTADKVNGKGRSGDSKNGEGGGDKKDGAEKDSKEVDREKEREREIEKSKEKERFPSLSTTYELPDGNMIDVSDKNGSASHLADALFENSTADGRTRRALSNMVFDAITGCDMDMRRELFGGIVLTGGCSLIPGTVERFTRELAILTPQMFKMKIIASQTSIERTGGPWIGGSIVSGLGTFQQAWVSKKEYEELGSAGCLRKCP